MASKGGRPPGRALTALEQKHLRLLFDTRTQAHDEELAYAERLEDFVLELQEAGASSPRIAAALGVGDSTVQRWGKHAQQRRDQE